ncbi:MAG TPA: hypothetical protein VFE07_02045 [Marmoricola sp.]|nr:hypothetical protein [Marmoricola sp.]
MSVRRQDLAAAVALLTTVAALMGVAGCGGDDDSRPEADATTTTSTPGAEATGDIDPGLPSNTDLQQPKAESTIEPQATLTAVPGASELPAQGRLRTIQGFPVPAGAKVKDPGPLEDTWQFDIHSDDLKSLLSFYERVLPQMGFRVRTGVTYTLGAEKVYWDIVFDGPISGTMVRDPDNGVLFVVVNPPGQPAIAGEQ